ncbi:MAG TPA: c-type cytochrome domain-containing protein [Candidatus Acidoferrum sp.]|nr:c-type cytochrome domain-containing protein [Candidatus Acidoferrum sp.]
MRSFLASSSLAVLALAASAAAQEKVTFQDHILPVVEANCAKCHNSDKKKGDLDLTSYSGTIAGAASGKVVVSGDVDSSKLWKVINHSEEPTMPPNRGKIADKDLAVFKKWIAGGLLENLGSKAIAVNKPSVDLSLAASSIGKPDGPPPMPGDLLLDPVVAVKRATAVMGLASSPWAPVFAVAGQKQVVLYHSESLNVLGILPFTDGVEIYQPSDVKFSRNGKLLVVGGGHAAKTGRVTVFDITTGERIITVGAGQEFDTVLAADISPDQSKIATGGPSKMVRLYSTKDGSLLFKMKKHTDWVTTAAFSPNGEYLATGDRNGGVIIWDADNGLEVHTVVGHKAAVTALSWRGDSKVVASVSEDGAVKIWETSEGKQVKTWTPHAAGTLSIAYSHGGKFVTCGRDGQVVSWTADGTKDRTFAFTNELAVRVSFNHDDSRVIAADWKGKVTIWETNNVKPLAELQANPPPIAEQLVLAEARLKELQSGSAKPPEAQLAAEAGLAAARKQTAEASNSVAQVRVAVTTKEAATEKLKAQLAAKPTPELQIKVDAARETRNKSRLALTNAVVELSAKAKALAKAEAVAREVVRIDPAAEMAEFKSRISRLKTGQAYAKVYRTRESIAVNKREQEKLFASGTKAGKSAAEKLGQEISKQEKALRQLASDYEKMKSASLNIPTKSVQQSKL